MPNWCSTSFTVRGPEDEIRKFYDNVLRTEDADGLPTHNIKILEAYVPCPQELRDTTATTALREIPESWQKQVDEGNWTQEDYDKRVAENNELLKKQEENLAKFGSKDWYDWQCENWGVKWGDCDTGFDGKPAPYGHNDLWMVAGYFQTPWGTATAGWRNVSKKFPNCIFIFDSDEEAGFFAGIEMIHDGDVVFEDYFEPCEYPEEVDWDDDDQVEAYEEWKDTNMTKICDSSLEYLRNRNWLPQPVMPDKPKVTKTTGKNHFWK